MVSLCVAFPFNFSKTCGVDSFTGSVSTVSVPVIATRIITLPGQTSTVFRCPSSPSPPVPGAVTTPITSCTPTPFVTVLPFATTATTVTTFSFSLQTRPDGEFMRCIPVCFSKTYGVDSFTGSVSTVSVPVIATRIITLPGQTSTIFRCPSSPSPPVPGVVTTTTTPPLPSPTPAVNTRTTAQPPQITGRQIGAITDGMAFTINSTPTAIPASVSQSQTSNIAPIMGGALGGFVFLIGVFAIAWFIRCVYVTRPWT